MSFNLRFAKVRRCVLYAALTLSIVPPLPAQAPASPTAVPPTAQALNDQVEAYMQAAVRNAHFSGTILVARNGVPVVHRAYGMANVELHTPNSTATVYDLASVSKQFTATLIMQLKEQGKLDIANSICTWVERCPPAWRAITLRHLLTHTSGITNFSSLPNWDEELSHRTYSRSTLLALFRDLPLEFAPGTKYRYSNSGYFLLGMVIESVTKRAYGDVLRSNITEPLGMVHTSFNDNRLLVDHRATAYYSLGTSFINARQMSLSTLLGAGGIQSTTADLLRWDQALYTNQLLSPASRQEMFTPVLNGYGYGWQTGESLGRTRVDHSGSFRGFSTYIVRFLRDSLTVIVLSNSDRASGSGTGMDLARIAFGEPYVLPTLKLRDRLYDTVVGSGVSVALKQVADIRRDTPALPLDETLLDVGYDLLEAARIADAIAVFEYNISLHPKSAYSYDGLGDAALAMGNDALARRHFETSLKIDPSNRYAIDALKRMAR
jgi:CubicO group peptidase (beta-lactamase class C family)